MKKNIKNYIRAILYSLGIGLIGMGIPFITSFLLFGLSGINQQMVNANNMLMGIVGGPVIFLLTKKYYHKQLIDSEELDLFTLKGLKKSLFGGLIGIILSISLFSIIILEECIFRGILKSAFNIHGKVASIIIPTIFFVMMHTSLWINFNILSMLELFFAGILFGVIIIHSKSLSCVVAAHTLYNFFYDIFGLESDGEIITTISPTTVFNLPGEQVITAMFILVLITITIILLIAKKKYPNT